MTIDYSSRTDFLHGLLYQARAHFHGTVAGIVMVVPVLILLALAEVGGPLVAAALVVAYSFILTRSYRALTRAYATVEQIYRREDARCKPWGY